MLFDCASSRSELRAASASLLGALKKAEPRRRNTLAFALPSFFGAGGGGGGGLDAQQRIEKQSLRRMIKY
jgi:hypothetical protein